MNRGNLFPRYVSRYRVKQGHVDLTVDQQYDISVNMTLTKVKHSFLHNITELLMIYTLKTVVNNDLFQTACPPKH